MKGLPKVLIIGQPFNNDTGGGITLSNLFSGWNREKLAVACSPYLLLDNIDTSICNTYYQLGQKEHHWYFPFNIIKRKYNSGLVKFTEKKIQNLTIPISKLRVKLIMQYFYPALESLGMAHAFEKMELSKEFCDWVKDYNPDVLYVQVSGRADILFCIAVQTLIKKPMAFHMMDDWPSTISEKGLFKNYRYKRIDRVFRMLLDKASLLLSISDFMAEEYKKRYNKNFITFHNPINIEFWKKYQRNKYEINNSPTILYAGRIGLGIEESLKMIARAVQLVNEELGMNIKFVLQTAEQPEWSKKYSCVLHKQFSAYNDLPRLFSEADFLMLPYDFSPLSIKYIKFSMPTKAPEFMISGTPIIVFAPRETGIVSYAEKFKWAKVVTENDISKLTLAIKELVQNETVRRTIAQNAIALAEEKFAADKVTKEFRNAIMQISHIQ